MPQLHRSLRAARATTRRRHRTWMLSMTLASAAWGCWWLDLVLTRFVPDVVPSFALVSTVASLLAGAGFLVALITLRGRNGLWLAIAAIPLMANLSLLLVPYLIDAEGLRQLAAGGA